MVNLSLGMIFCENGFYSFPDKISNLDSKTFQNLLTGQNRAPVLRRSSTF